MTKKRRKSYECLNCGFKLKDYMNYCPNCGQENNDVRVGVKVLINDFLKDYITFDSKIFRSLRPLLFSPGKLSLEFSEGRRNQYIPPIRLYLFISFIFFFLSSLDMLDNDKSLVSDEKDSIVRFDLNDDSTSIAKADTVKTPSTNEGFMGINQQKILHFMELPDKKKEELLSSGVSIMMFVFLPLYALLLYFVFYRSRKLYVEHLVFSFHLHSFYFLLFSLSILLGALLDQDIFIVVSLLLILVYTFIAIKKVYQKHNLWALFQTCIVFLFQTIFLMIGFFGVIMGILIKMD